MLKDPTANPAFQHRILRALPGAELITYKPLAGVPRKVWAMVNRQPADSHYSADLARQARMTITVVNDATLGIALAEYDAGGDRIAVALRIGDTPQDFEVVGEPVTQDAGLVTFAVR